MLTNIFELSPRTVLALFMPLYFGMFVDVGVGGL